MKVNFFLETVQRVDCWCGFVILNMFNFILEMRRKIRLSALAVLQFVTLTFLSLSDSKYVAVTEAVNDELPRRAGFVPKRIHLGFVMGQVLLQEFRFFLFLTYL
jgi:hypothetical protein